MSKSTTTRAMPTHATPTPSTEIGTARSLLLLLLLLALTWSVAACNEYQECADDAECGAGQVCVRSRSGWVESSFCAPADPVDMVTVDTVEPDVDEGCGFNCSPPVPGASCLADRTTVCELACVDGFNADCDGELANGCETNLQSDAENCGVCGSVCDEELAEDHVTGVCERADCVPTACAEGWLDLDADPGDGCSIQIGAPVRASSGTPAIDTVARVATGTFFTAGGTLYWQTDVKAMAPTPGPAVQLTLTNSSPAVQLRASDDPARPTQPWAAAVTEAGRVDIARVTGDSLGRLSSIAETPGTTGVDIADWRVGNDGNDGLEVAVVSADAASVLKNCASACTESSVALNAPVSAQPAVRIVDFESVRQLLVTSRGPSVLDPAPDKNIFEQFRPSTLVVSRANVNSAAAPFHVLDIEPWLGTATRADGMILLHEDGEVALWEYTGDPSSVTGLALDRTLTELPAGITDIAALGRHRFAAVTPEGITIFSVAGTDAEPLEPERITFALPELDPAIMTDAHGPISFDPETQTLAVAYGTRLYLIPLTLEP